MLSPWSFCDIKSPQVHRTLLSNLPDLKYAVVSMVSTHRLISMSSSSFMNMYWTNQLLWVSLSLSCSIVFSSLARSRYLFLFLVSFSFTLWSVEMAKSTIRQVVYLLNITRSGLQADIRWLVFNSKSQRNCEFHFLGRILVCTYTICS